MTLDPVLEGVLYAGDVLLNTELLLGFQNWGVLVVLWFCGAGLNTGFLTNESELQSVNLGGPEGVATLVLLVSTATSGFPNSKPGLAPVILSKGEKTLLH